VLLNIFMVRVCFYCVRFSFSVYLAKRLAGKSVSEMTYFMETSAVCLKCKIGMLRLFCIFKFRI